MSRHESKVHELKIAPKYMNAQLFELKNFEIRKNDRDFKVGDRLLLREWDKEHYTRRQLTVYVTYVTDYEQKEGYVVLGTCPISKITQNTVDTILEMAK